MVVVLRWKVVRCIIKGQTGFFFLVVVGWVCMTKTMAGSQSQVVDESESQIMSGEVRGLLVVGGVR